MAGQDGQDRKPGLWDEKTRVEELKEEIGEYIQA